MKHSKREMKIPLPSCRNCRYSFWADGYQKCKEEDAELGVFDGEIRCTKYKQAKKGGEE